MEKWFNLTLANTSEAWPERVAPRTGHSPQPAVGAGFILAIAHHWPSTGLPVLLTDATRELSSWCY